MDCFGFDTLQFTAPKRGEKTNQFPRSEQAFCPLNQRSHHLSAPCRSVPRHAAKGVGHVQLAAGLVRSAAVLDDPSGVPPETPSSHALQVDDVPFVGPLDYPLEIAVTRLDQGCSTVSPRCSLLTFRSRRSADSRTVELPLEHPVELWSGCLRETFRPWLGLSGACMVGPSEDGAGSWLNTPPSEDRASFP